MAWETEMVRYVRLMINDLDEENYLYSDTRLQEVILMAAQQVWSELDFNQDYTIDFDAFEITPDPTEFDAGTREEAFINLVCLKAACIVDRAEYRQASKQSVDIQDNRSRVILRGPAEGGLAMLQHGWCKEYADAKDQYAYAKQHNVGAAIMTPFPYDGYRGRHYGRGRYCG